MNGERDYIVYLQDMLEFATKGIDFVKGFNLLGLNSPPLAASFPHAFRGNLFKHSWTQSNTRENP